MKAYGKPRKADGHQEQWECPQQHKCYKHKERQSARQLILSEMRLLE